MCKLHFKYFNYLLKVGRWIAKQHAYIEGDIPPEVPKENLTLVVQNLCREKWGETIDRREIGQIHRLGRNKIIIKFLDLRKGSAFNRLLNRKPNGVDYLPK